MGALLVYGASGHGKVVADTARAAGFERVAYADDDESKRGLRLAGANVEAIGQDEALAWLGQHRGAFVVGIGHNRIRERVATGLEERGAEAGTLIHPHAWVSPTVRLDPGTVVFAGVVVQAEARVGRHTILNTSCSVDHDCVIEDFVHLSPGVHLGGAVTIDRGAHLGVGVSVIQVRRIGAWSTVGAGASVVRDVPADVVAYGVPATVRRAND